MSIFNTIVTNFTAGEISPRLMGRIDIAQYYNAAKTLYNMILHPQGGVTRRAGTHFVQEVKNSASSTILLPFEFSNQQAYAIEVGHQYMRFYMDQGNIATTGGSVPYEIDTTINEASLQYLRYAQSADTMYLVSAQGDMPPAKLERHNHASWTFGNITFTQDPFNGATTTGYPKNVGFFEQRSVWANTPGDPQKVWFSKSADYENLSVGTADDDGIAVTIAADNVNPILWMTPQRVLLFGTSGGEWRISSESVVEPLTPTNILARRDSNYGAESVPAVAVGPSILYVQRHGRKLRELAYSVEYDGYNSQDLSLLSEHLTNPGNSGASIVQIAFQQEPDSILWCLQGDGKLIGLTYNRPQKVMGWHRHESDGASGRIESIAVIPGTDRDELWMIARRTVNAASRFIEFMENTDFADQEDAWYVDCGLDYSGSAATMITGLTHLNGASVDILADGAAVARQTVNAGSIVLANAASRVICGLPFTSQVQTVRMEAGNQTATLQGKKRRVHSMAVRLYRSSGFEMGKSDSELDDVPIRTTSGLMDTAETLFTGDKVIKAFPGDWDKDGYIWIQQEKPLPLTVLSIIPRFSISEM